MRFWGFAVSAVAAAVAWGQAASAGTVTENFTFTASGFTAFSAPGVVAPIDPVQGSFSLTFDPGQFYDFGDAAVDALIINVPLNAQSGTPQFLYEPSSQQLLVGMSYNGGGGSGSGSDDFILSLFLGFPYDENAFSYVQERDNNLYQASSVTFTIDPPLPSQTPLPADAPMLLTGLGTLGFIGWRRKRAA